MSPGRLLRLALCGLATTAFAAAAEVIRDFHSRIDVAANAGLLVTETVLVRAEGAQIRHGIYRDFPNLYRGRWGLRSATGFAVVSVTRDGASEPWHTEARENGVRVYLGAASDTVPVGEHRYELAYRTDRQLGFFSDHDELYWNVTGNGWIFPIEQTSAEVHLPEGVRVTRHEAYTGPAGAKGRDYTSGLDSSVPNVVRFSTTRRLEAREGFTLVASWPPGVIHAESKPDNVIALLRANPGVSLGLLGLVLVFVYYLVVWSLVGRDPAKGTIIPLYAPPAGFSPAAVRHLARMGFDQKCYVANLISLAVKGALTISESGGIVSIHRKNARAALLPDEQVLFTKLLGGRPHLTFEPVMHTSIRDARTALQEKLSATLEKVYFFHNTGYWVVGLLFSLIPLGVTLLDLPQVPPVIFLTAWLSLWTLGVTALLSNVVTRFRGRQYANALFLGLFSIPFLAGELFAIGALVHLTSVWAGSLFAIGLGLNGIFYHLLKAPTLAGRRTLDQIEGFRRYLSVAEKDRLNLENPPDRTPELFDRFLPYALALDVEQQWAQQFAEILANAERANQPAGYSPAWYSGAAFSTAALGDFGATLGSSIGTAISSSSSSPGSSSGGGGGGSSGGGGGGGGGGGW